VLCDDMAIRLEKAGWYSADSWLRRQTSYDLAQARKGEDWIQVFPESTSHKSAYPGVR